ncbi:hypothetical protein GCM10008967_05530 [Bacillus carboniphilus]|uniref:Uncharacterized protein n=1 Tax=Bacillus carboniphilus TaxID=86663 RepID=A0ABN0VUS4_9BACI
MGNQTETKTNEIDHRKIAVECFNAVWDLLDKHERTPEEIDRMIHMAHTSRYHWEQVGAPVNLSRGEWQISRVYSVLKRSEPALFHAKRNLEICQEYNIEDFDLAFAYEALARAYKVSGDENLVNTYRELAISSAEKISKEADKKYFLQDLSTI